MDLLRVFPLSDWAKNLTMRIFYRACRNAARAFWHFQLLTHHYIARRTLPLLQIFWFHFQIMDHVYLFVAISEFLEIANFLALYQQLQFISTFPCKNCSLKENTHFFYQKSKVSSYISTLLLRTSINCKLNSKWVFWFCLFSLFSNTRLYNFCNNLCKVYTCHKMVFAQAK